MRSVMLSACGNDAAEYCNGAAEAGVMEAILALLADYLRASGLRALRRPAMVPSHAVASVANRERADLLLLLRSSAAPLERVGELRGADICFHPAAQRARALAGLLRGRLAAAAPEAEQVRLLPSPQLPDFRMAHCPAVQLRLGYRDHPEDAVWMLQSTGVIAHALAGAVTEWFALPCVSPFAERRGVVRTPNGSLALRRAPRKEAEMLRMLPAGTELTLLHREGEWQYVECDGVCGFVARRFLLVDS